MSRTIKSYKNIITALLGQSFGYLLSFISRFIFIQILGTQYLGINGLFTNILTVLSLAEMGIGPAIVYSLYKPIAEDDTEQIKGIMNFISKTYSIIGSIIIIVGFVISQYLNVFIKEMPEIDNIELIFMLFVFNTAVSYFYAYKRNLIIANQNRFVINIIHLLKNLGFHIVQIIILYLTKNYILYLMIQIIFTLIENIVISKKANELFPYLKERSNIAIDKEILNGIKKNTGAMVFHRIGSVIVNSTDNILISIKIGIESVGVYSNYLLIINSLNSIIAQIFSSITASAGNLGVSENKIKTEETFESINFINFWIYSVSANCLLFLLNPFIGMWLGDIFILNSFTSIVLVINYYLKGMRKSVLTFRDALGLYYYDRYKPLFESFINLVASLILVRYFGLVGIFIGTTISTVFVCLWIEPLVLYKYGFNSSVSKYFKKYLEYTLITLLSIGVSGLLLSLFNHDTIITFIYSIFICIAIPNLIIVIAYFKNKDFKYLLNKIKIIIMYLKSERDN
jgi:O-antigen/teichoic acid export membrane protein